MDDLTILGLAAGGLTTLSLVPQVMKTWRSKSARDVSLGMYAIFISGLTLWGVYGVLRRDASIVIANAMTLVLSLAVVAMKLTYKSRD
ncbi:MAG: SemiSWEET transporter [Deltaproteobacteria bacterium]|nr:SemiSWEET transporter [Deltaproteobacteria bacterium]